MIPALGPISVHHIGFAVVATGLILLAWSRWKTFFPAVFLAASLVIVATWLGPLDALALAVFLAAPYPAIACLWGRKDTNGFPLMAGVIVFLVILFVYLKRYDWIAQIPLFSHPIAIIGLSFMLFRVIHLVVEAPYLGHLPFGPGRYLGFVLAFWTLISGPIQRYDAFVHGMAAIGRPPDAEALRFAHRTVTGLIKAFLIAPLFLGASDLSLLRGPSADWLDFAVVFYAYPVYLYLNFSGYTDAMIGIAGLCGMTTMPENFNRPYLARNIQDFWGRWHMSFGTWIKHYLFTPLMKSLLSIPGGRTKDVAATVAAVVITFLVVGAWHGTSASFIVFGLLHGLAVLTAVAWGMLLVRLLGKKGRRQFENRPWVRVTAIFLCFHYVCATFALIPNDLGVLARTLRHFLLS